MNQFCGDEDEDCEDNGGDMPFLATAYYAGYYSQSDKELNSVECFLQGRGSKKCRYS